MKRFAVLFGMLVIVACGSAFATAPQVGDMPDIALDVSSDASGLPEVATPAYDVMDYVQDVDDAATVLTTTIINSSAATIDIGGATQVSGMSSVGVDIYGNASAGWFQYTVRVDDASTVAPARPVGLDAISDVAVAKFSTFNLDAPTISDGVVLTTGGQTSMSRQFVYCWIGGSTAELYRLDTAIDPASASATLDWELYLNSVVQDSTEDNFNDNGTWTGITSAYLDDGTLVNAGNLYAEIGTDGTISLTSSGQITGGPWLLGVLATNQGDSNDSDGSRLMVATAMLAEASPDTATIGESVTFDDIPGGTVSDTASDVYLTSGGDSAYVGSAPDGVTTMFSTAGYTGCHWRNDMAGPNDSVLEAIPLTVVTLSSDTDLPVAAQLVEGSNTAHIAGGNALKATFPVPPSGTVGPRYNTSPEPNVQAPGFRLQSRVFTPIAPTDVLTFSLNVATDVALVTDLPRYQMAIGSGLGTTLAGYDIRTLHSTVGIVESGAGNPVYTTPQHNMPMADQGWQTLSVTYSPGSSIAYYDFTGDGQMTQADLDILATIGAPQGWDSANDQTAAIALFQAVGQNQQTSVVNLWMDNLRVYKSAYAVDLALGAESLTDAIEAGDNAGIDYLAGLGAFTITSGDLDGTIEAYSSTGDSEVDFDAIGLTITNGAGNGPVFRDPEQDYVDAASGYASMWSTSTSDHTLNGGSSTSIRVQLPGTDDDGADGGTGALDAVRAQMLTATVAGSGDGIYAVEAFLGKSSATNLVNTFRHPGVRVLISEVAPNWLGPAGGVLHVQGGLPDTIAGDTYYGWERAVAEMYIPDCELFRGAIQVLDTFKASNENFAVPIFIDDISLYRVDDPATFFDADLFDGV